MKNKFVFICLILLFSNCSNRFNLAKINSLTITANKIKLKEDLNFISSIYENDETELKEQKEIWINDSESKLTKRINRRAKIIDSLKIKNGKDINFIIIDEFSHNYAGEYEVNNIFYNNQYVYSTLRLSRKPPESTIFFNSIEDDLVNHYLDDTTKRIYQFFNIPNLENLPHIIPISLSDHRFVKYEIIVVNGGRVKFFQINSTKFKDGKFEVMKKDKIVFW